MPTAAASEILARLQPKASFSGTISTPGVERTPAATSNARKITPATTNTYFWPNGRVLKRRAGGVDSFQALQLALSAVGVELLISDQPVYRAERDDDLGLPMLDVMADEIAERKARFEGK